MTTRPQWAPQSLVRTARKSHICRGSGGGSAYRQFAEGHTEEIKPGEQYLEYLGESPAYHSGTAHCMACAAKFYTNWNEEGSVA